MRRILQRINPVYLLLFLCCNFYLQGISQKKTTTGKFSLFINHKDSTAAGELPKLKSSFVSLKDMYDYINGIPRLLTSQGFAAASVDSVWQQGDSAYADLYAGTKYNWIRLKTQADQADVLSKTGYSGKNFEGKAFDISKVESIRKKLLEYYENNGYPFASVYLDSISISQDSIDAVLKIDRNELYHVDSIRNNGNLRLNKRFLQHYLEMSNGSIYSKEKLQRVDRKMNELPYADPLQTSALNMLGSGAVLNLFVNQRKSSQVSAILGLLPDANNTGKFQLTGDINLDLKNVFAGGEGLLLRYQALQPRSPRLNLGFEKPFVFQSQFGLSLLFDLYKRDSAYLNLSATGGLQLNLDANQSGRVIVQFQRSNLLQGGFDTNIIKLTRRLPDNIDVTAVNGGINYDYSKTNDRFNPRTGNELGISALAGIRNIQKNNDIVALKSTGFNYASLYDSIKLKSYQLRIRTSAAHYFPVAKAAVIKVALNAGIYSSPDIFRNEVFQIGGYRLLRGFDEESIYVNQFAVVTAEYRYILLRNSYLFAFTDVAATKSKFSGINTSNFFLGAGGGILYETKAGLLNLSLALGTRDEVPFNLRGAAKIHFGYINYF